MMYKKMFFLAFILGTFGLSAAYAAPQPVAEPVFTLPYRAENRWVHMEDNAPLNALTSYAKAQQIYTFKVILPESSKTNLYIERLLVLSRIMKSRLKQESIVFRQELGKTPSNTIQVTPLREEEAAPTPQEGMQQPDHTAQHPTEKLEQHLTPVKDDLYNETFEEMLRRKIREEEAVAKQEEANKTAPQHSPQRNSRYNNH